MPDITSLPCNFALDLDLVQCSLDNRQCTMHIAHENFKIMVLLVVARGFPRCKPNRIPDKMPEDKMLENNISKNGKPDRMPDNLTRTLALTSP